MRMPRFASLTFGLLLLASPALAQAPAAKPPAPAAAAKPDTTKGKAQVAELVFEREVFQYPAYQRRNPFQPLVGNTGNGPRFEQVQLRGIIWSAEPQRSVALFGMAGAQAVRPDSTGAPTTKRLRVGESWGNMRVTEIQKDRVVLAVEEFGLTENKTLALTRKRTGAGGGQ
jgi:hypothetical protein